MSGPGTSFAHRASRLIGVLIVAAGSALLLLGATEAQAVITEPIPADVGPGPPDPIPALTPAGETAPPSTAIGDPITPEATCGDWYRQGNYGDRWPAGSTWWEYRCTRSDSQYYNYCDSMACPAFCWDCWGETWEWTDYFYWNGTEAVFYGELYSYSAISEGYMWPPYTLSYWWDAPTARWYDLSQYSLTVSKRGTGSGTISSSPAGISCGASCEASFDAGTLVTLTATPDASSTFSGWSGPCSGTGNCQVTMDQARSVTATFAVNLPPDMPPQASFIAACSGSSCSFDGTASGDADGTIVEYAWDFGDGDNGSGATAEHTYAAPGTYTVTLIVVDDRESWDIASQVVTVEASASPVAPLPPIFISTPDDYSSDSTPTWSFSGESGTTFTCTLTKPFVGAWDGGGDGTQPEPDPVTVDARACDSGSYTFDLGAYPDGTYALAVTQTDAAGHTSGAATDSFVLQRPVSPNAAPQADVAFSCAALSCSFDGTASSDADGTIVAYAWDFGDGGNGSGATVEHTYAGPGIYTVTLTVTDDDSGSTTDSTLVTVEAPPPESPLSPVLPPPSEEGPSLTPPPPPRGQGDAASVTHPDAVRCGGRSATVLGSTAGERLTGTPHSDVIAGLGGNDEIRGLGAGDILCGGAGADRLLGGSGPDKMLGGPGADALFGGPGHDLETP